jgi:hypothetical protein
MKTCSKCKRELDESEFSKNKSKKDGLANYCKKCKREYNKEYYADHKEESKEYRKINKEEKKIYCKEYNQTHKEEKKLYNKIYQSIHRPERNEYLRNKRKTDSNFRIYDNIRVRIKDALKEKNKSAHTLELLGCDIQNAKLYLQWTAIQNGYKDFDIDNYSGEEYEIDHITPCAIFNMEDPNQQKECFNWRNMQILTIGENQNKYDKLLY